MGSLVQPLENHPLPTDAETAAELLADNPQFDGRDVPHPDTLHTEYVDTLSKTHEWHVFRVPIYGLTGYVYVWNHQLGEGFRVPDLEGEFESLAGALGDALED